MVERPLEAMAHQGFALHRRHNVLRNFVDCGMLVAEGTGESGSDIEVDFAASMLSVTAQAAKIVQRGDRETFSRYEADVAVGDVNAAMRIVVGDIAMATDASVVRRTAPRLMASGATAVELGVRAKEASRLIAGARSKYEQRKRRYHASGGYPSEPEFHTPAKYSTPIT
jgi:hypothetical protein